jgi:sec-independent protein translocase protein TatA
MSLGPLEIIAIVLVILLLFGYKKLPDASRSLGRSLRIFKGEMKGMKDDDARESVRAKDAAQTSPVRGEIVAPSPAAPVSSADGDLTARLNEEARIAEARAAEARARADQARATDGPR